MNERELKIHRRTRRAHTVRKRIRQESARPRLSVHRSLKHISAQVIDDKAGRTLASASTYEKALVPAGGEGKRPNKSDLSKIIGETIAKRALEKGVKEVVFDRGSFRFHGRVKALADAARGAGLKF
jgi:large subunit ribosomal protein L18